METNEKEDFKCKTCRDTGTILALHKDNILGAPWAFNCVCWFGVNRHESFPVWEPSQASYINPYDYHQGYIEALQEEARILREEPVEDTVPRKAAHTPTQVPDLVKSVVAAVHPPFDNELDAALEEAPF